jgi:hypothetical protein
MSFFSPCLVLFDYEPPKKREKNVDEEEKLARQAAGEYVAPEK